MSDEEFILSLFDKNYEIDHEISGGSRYVVHIDPDRQVEITFENSILHIEFWKGSHYWDEYDVDLGDPEVKIEIFLTKELEEFKKAPINRWDRAGWKRNE